jgi:sugar lactone lactonase YvrE
MKSSIYSLAFCAIILFSCKKDSEPAPNPPPSIQADKTSVTISGQLNASDSFNLQSNGAWTISFTPSTPSWISLNATSGNGNKKIIITTLQANNTGSSRSVTLNIVPGSGSPTSTVSVNITQSTNDALSVTTISPNHGPAFTVVTINGTGFNPNMLLDRVFFNGIEATVVSATSSIITAKVPVGAGTGNVSVRVMGNTITGPVFNYELSAIATVIAGSGGAGVNNGIGTAASFATPTGLTVDTFGNIYVSDLGAFEIRKITPAGVVSYFAGNPFHQGNVDGTGTGALFAYVNDVDADLAGNVYVADYDNGNIRKVTPAGVVTTIASGFPSPTGIAVDHNGYIYIVAPTASYIMRFSPTGQREEWAGQSATSGSSDGPAATATFDEPYGVTVDGAGNVYVVDWRKQNVRKITQAGMVTTIAGIAGVQGFTNGPGSMATFKTPRAIAADNNGNLYIADVGNNAIRKIDASGNVSTYLDHVSSYTTDQNYFGAYGVAVDKNGVVYVTNTSENKVIRITIQ